MARFDQLPNRPAPGEQVSDDVPAPWREPHLPLEAQKMGLMPVTAPELAFASALRPEKRLHKVIAWIGLAAVGLSFGSGLVQLVRSLTG